MKGKGGALSVWISEFVSLVFTQTIQAFIYAIVISIILYGMQPNSTVSSNDNNSALGLMATFALLSVFKIEGFAKQIFGFKDNKAAPGNAMKSLAKTAFALQLGKRVLNNAGKVTGGIGAIAKSRQDNAKAKKRLEEDMADNGYKRDKDGNLVYSGGSSKVSGGGFSTDGEPSAVQGYSGGGASGEISDSAKRRMKNALRAYEDKSAEIKKARQEGIKNIVSGNVEFIGSVVGATAGGVIGVSDGDIEGLINGAIAGAGVGDAAGESLVGAITKATSSIKNTYSRGPGLSTKKLNAAIAEYKSAIENSNVIYKNDSVDDV